MKLLLILPVGVLFFLFPGMSAQGMDSTTTCNICTLELSYNSIANALTICNLTATMGTCQADCASTLQSIRTNYGCCFNAYYNSTGSLSTRVSSLAAYELWASCNVSVPSVCSNPFPEDSYNGSVCTTVPPTTTGGALIANPAVEMVAGWLLLAIMLIGMNYWSTATLYTYGPALFVTTSVFKLYTKFVCMATRSLSFVFPSFVSLQFYATEQINKSIINLGIHHTWKDDVCKL